MPLRVAIAMMLHSPDEAELQINVKFGSVRHAGASRNPPGLPPARSNCFVVALDSCVELYR
jgi:hypothetical protein